MAATPRKIPVDVEARVTPPVTRAAVHLIPQDDPTRGVLDEADRGPFPMSPRNFVVGHIMRIKKKNYRIQAVVHDPEVPAGVFLVVSHMQGTPGSVW